MISYYDGQLTDILPGNIAAYPEVRALSYALQQGCRLLYRYSQNLYIYSYIDGQSEEVIDLLAAELRTQYYRRDMELEIKRKLVKNTVIWYMTAGTPAAVEELVATVFGEGEVKEWFEYGDEPFYFKIITSALLIPEMDAFFTDMIQKVKNVRSHLRTIDIKRMVSQEIYLGIGGQYLQYKPADIIDGHVVESEIIHNIYMGNDGT